MLILYQNAAKKTRPKCGNTRVRHGRVLRLMFFWALCWYSYPSERFEGRFEFAASTKIGK
jgi:hypothetical protein